MKENLLFIRIIGHFFSFFDVCLCFCMEIQEHDALNRNNIQNIFVLCLFVIIRKKTYVLSTCFPLALTIDQAAQLFLTSLVAL